MHERGWTYAETAKRVREELGEGAKFTKASISHYTRGRSVPRLRNLEALSAVLEKELMREDSLTIPNGRSGQAAVVGPEREGAPQLNTTPPALHIEDRGSEAWLQINQQLPWPVALKILGLLKEQ
jgi:transcriptional regulator with XRE-family HTH domain